MSEININNIENQRTRWKINLKYILEAYLL